MEFDECQMHTAGTSHTGEGVLARGGSISASASLAWVSQTGRVAGGCGGERPSSITQTGVTVMQTAAANGAAGTLLLTCAINQIPQRSHSNGPPHSLSTKQMSRSDPPAHVEITPNAC